MNRILFLVNHDVVIYNFRLELVERFIAEGYEVHISSPYGERIDDLVSIGAVFHDIKMNRHGMNPFKEFKLLVDYYKLLKSVKPFICLGFTIKPNVYGGIAARILGIPFVANVTGLGTSIQNGGIKQRISLMLYRIGLKGAQKVFFQNEQNCSFMVDNKIVSSKFEILPGSGVNLKKHCYEQYPPETDKYIFTTLGRIMKDKGTDELIAAAQELHNRGVPARFRVIGFFDDDYEKTIMDAVKSGFIEYIEQQKDVHGYIKQSYAIIQPSHHEGLSNVLLEAEATGRPVIASDIPGCRETFEEGVSGYGFEVKNSHSLADAVVKFISLPYDSKVNMGIEARKKMEREFDRNIVVEKYMQEVNKAGGH